MKAEVKGYAKSALRLQRHGMPAFCCTHKVIYPKYSKQWPLIVAHTIDCVSSKMLNRGYLFHFLSLYPATYIELNVCYTANVYVKLRGD